MARAAFLTAAVVALVLLAAGAATGGWFVTAHVRAASVSTAPAKTPAALRAAAAPPTSGAGQHPGLAVPPPTQAGVTRWLANAVRQHGLGGRLRARVVALSSGAVLYDHGGTAPTAPASTAKLLTATAILAARGARYRIPTVVRRGGGGAVVLVGGGDPTLTGTTAGKPGAYAGAARLTDLAAAIRAAGVRPTRIVVDDGLFRGPAISPSWAPDDVPTDYASAITAVMTDGGRAAPTAVNRSVAPDLAAGRELARALGEPKLRVTRSTAPATGALLGRVDSASVGTLITQMLLQSDNVIAECLARQVAVAEHLSPSFTGGAAAIRRVLARLGVPIGPGMVDGSGLAPRDRVSMASLTSTLRVAAATPALRYLFGALPIAGWSGTLSGRYVNRATRSAAGDVRAKTGTLTGVSSLAGVVHDRSGQTLLFAFDADRASNTAAAEAALDTLTTRLAACGC